jgi:group I intron endonuclease
MNNKEKISGIYKWINKVNGKYYVGSSMDILSNVGRKTNHLYMLRGKYHNNEHFQRAWNKYGEENFEFIVIENLPDITDKELLQIEQKYLDIAKLERDKCYNK